MFISVILWNHLNLRHFPKDRLILKLFRSEHGKVDIHMSDWMHGQRITTHKLLYSVNSLRTCFGWPTIKKIY